MKAPSTLCVLLATLLPLAAVAQTSPGSPAFDPASPPAAGTMEFTIGGGGISNKDLDDSLGGINFSVGQYVGIASQLVLRQSINYSNPDVGGDSWVGSTRIAFDQHILARGTVRPFVGVNLGGVYGDGVSDSFAAGLEAGAKFYVIPRTFIYVMAEYDWLFRKAKDLNNRFDDGQFNWSVGVGFHF
ncbi:MAG TPA: hypothetical protein VHO24_02260 [Opitutaceae bacterium]|nr:hypothetical protein [Opitutaceae bacterium]